MLNESCNILSGSQTDFRVPEGSVGKYLLDCLRNRDPRHVTMIDAISGKTLETGDILQSSIKATKILERFGIQKGDVIAIISENVTTYCVPKLAALYMGITVQLLNPLYSIGELKHALNIAKPKLFICSQSSVENVQQVIEDLQFGNEKVVLLEGSFENYESFETLLPNISYIDPETFEAETLDSSEQGALILMSSGTTGLPKGVLITHKNLRTVFDYLLAEEYVGYTISNVTVFILPFFHVFGVLGHIHCISVGMKMVLLKQFTPDVFLKSIQNYKPTLLFMVPSLLLFFAKSSLINNYDVSSITDAIVGGAPVGKQLYMDIMKRMPHLSVRQVYGATEASGSYTITKKNDIKIGSVGVLVPNMLAKVWDSDSKKAVGLLKTGELCFKGPMIMKGYLGNTSETKLCIDEDGFLHTGDLGFFDQDGHLYIVDRIKELIKYKGFQVPPAELEAIILTHHAVIDCGVIGIPNERVGQVPLAYVVKQKDVDVTQQEIIDFVAERISPEKRLHGGVRFIDEIPKNSTGKIMRRKLADIFNTSL